MCYLWAYSYGCMIYFTDGRARKEARVHANEATQQAKEVAAIKPALVSRESLRTTHLLITTLVSW